MSIGSLLISFFREAKNSFYSAKRERRAKELFFFNTKSPLIN